MRIGLVCPYSLDVPGGVQNHVRDLAAVLAARGHHVGVLAPGEATVGLPAYVEIVGRSVPVRYNGSVARLAFGPKVANRTKRWVLQGGFDLLHIHEPATPSVSLLALWAADCPVVATFHSAIPRSRTMSSVAGFLRPSMEKVTARIAVSEAARSTLVHHLGGEPVVIPNGLFCLPLVEARPRPQWTGLSGGPTIVFLGRTDEPRKGLAVLLAAFPRVLERHPAARLLVAGHGDEAPLDLLPESALRQVELIGRVSDEDRARLLASATVYVAPQTGGESFGIVLVEAMAAGAAVVASDLAAFRAVLGGGEFGALFPAGDATGAADVISRLLSDGERREALRLKASQEVRRYDWSRLTVDVEAVYSTVVAGPSRLEAAR